MELKLFRHLWGVDLPWEAAFARFKAEGYAGIETGLPPPENEGRFRELLLAHGFLYVAQVFSAGPTVDEQLESLRRLVDRAMALGPLTINAHTGRDHWPLADAVRFYTEAARIERRVRARLCHETHRGRAFYSPWATAAVLSEVPDLRLCCDYSHWVVVAERLLDEPRIYDLCASRCGHIHARVGYEEGPQVPDPSAPEYRRHLEAHERWWDMIWNAQEARGDAVTTMTPEFGPPMYLHTLPHTNVPVADLWTLCNWQARRQRDRFAARHGATPRPG